MTSKRIPIRVALALVTVMAGVGSAQGQVKVDQATDDAMELVRRCYVIKVLELDDGHSEASSVARAVIGMCGDRIAAAMVEVARINDAPESAIPQIRKGYEGGALEIVTGYVLQWRAKLRQATHPAPASNQGTE